MAKYVVSYEDGVEKRELWFRGEYYDYSMIPCSYGAKSDKPGFDTQYEKTHPEVEENDVILELLYEITNDNDVLDILEQLDELECDEY